jgi:hypothetical protein
MLNRKTLAFSLLCCLFLSPLSYAEDGADLLVEDATGTDPRDFGNKFMPYYRYTELDNGIEVDELALFGMHAFTKTFALTYELPVFKKLDISDPVNSLPMPPPIDKTYEGMGDLNLRAFSPLGRWAGMTWLGGVEVWLPTHTEDELGDDRINVAPMLANIKDLDMLPMPGAFIAMMHFAEFTAWKDEDISLVPQPTNPPGLGQDSNDLDTARYKGRWFFMIPINERYKLYTLTEIQPIYDFRTDEFSLWVGPELGKMIDGFGTVYIKPGWGVNNGSGFDRKFTFEAGFRWFL